MPALELGYPDGNTAQPSVPCDEEADPGNGCERFPQLFLNIYLIISLLPFRQGHTKTDDPQRRLRLETASSLERR